MFGSKSFSFGRRQRLATLVALYGTIVASPCALAFDITVSNQKPKQGQTIEVSLIPDASLPGSAVIEFNKAEYKLFPQTASNDNGMDLESGVPEDKLAALIAIPPDLKPGNYKLKVGGQSKTITVQSGNFPVQRLRLPASKNNFDTSPGEREAMSKAKNTLSDKRLWQGSFTMPSKARMSAGYGLRRIVNGKLLTDYNHSGIDFAAPIGSPVKATAPGKVVLARTGFKLHGNVVALDHGQGVISLYIHLSKVLVKEGQQVKAGETIGKVGQSGRASGPHLHFGLYVNQVAANPMDWFETSF